MVLPRNMEKSPATCELDNVKEATALYDKLEQTIIPPFYNQPEQFRNVMSYCIALNGSFFHTQSLVQRYVLKAYSC